MMELIEKQKQLSAARLEAQQIILKAKWDVIDKSFERAIAKLQNMTDNLYREFMESILAQYAENNDYVVVSKRDARRLTHIWLGEVSKKLNIRLTLSEDFHDEGGGVILCSKNCDRKLTFKAIADEIIKKQGHKLFDKLNDIR